MSQLLADLAREISEKRKLIRDGRPSFTCFKRLPPELRLKIWKFALPDPRLVTLTYSKPITYEPPPDPVFHLSSSESYQLQRCLLARKEFKEVFEKHYIRLSFVSDESSLHPADTTALENASLWKHPNTSITLNHYFDQARDTIHFSLKTLKVMEDKGICLNAPKIQHVALASNDDFFSILKLQVMKSPMKQRGNLSIWGFAERQWPLLQSFTLVPGNAEGNRPSRHDFSLEGSSLFLQPVNEDIRFPFHGGCTTFHCDHCSKGYRHFQLASPHITSSFTRYFDHAARIREEFNLDSTRTYSFWRKIEFQVSLLAESENEKNSRSWGIVVEERRKSTKYKSYFPPPRTYTRVCACEDYYGLFFHAEGLKAQMFQGMRGGEPVGIYHGVREMFEEGKAEEARNGDDGVLVNFRDAMMASNGK